MQHCDFKNAIIIIARSFIADRSDPPARWKVWIPAGANVSEHRPFILATSLVLVPSLSLSSSSDNFLSGNYTVDTSIYLLLLILASETLISEQSALSLSPAEFTRRFWIQRGNW
ncbi:hypothetical protein DTO212C5_7037 [Paecilomyces variotii]|nr:hypothetical protein DTO212C5_7037 [Paecilomyces variotii]